MPTYGYDKNVDYQKLINKDLEAQDYRSAAIHEAQRNEKIKGEGAAGQYPTTSHFADYLPQTEQINSGMDRLEGRTFTYDPETDPAYQSYRKQFLREADRQTRDTMAAYAGMTGGVPSTAAVSAAQQAGNYERSKLTDMIPTLMQNAYGRFTDQLGQDRQNLQLRVDIDRAREEQSLAQQQLAASQQAQQISRAMSQWAALGYANEYVASVLGVPVGTKTTDQKYQEWQQQMAEQEAAQARELQSWQMEQQGISGARELAMYLLNLGQMPNDQLLAQAGIDPATAQQISSAAAAQISAGSAAGSGGSGRSSGGRTYSGRTNQKTEQEGTAVQYGEGMASTDFAAVREALRQMIAKGNKAAVDQIMTSVSGKLSQAQQQELQGMIDQSGMYDSGGVRYGSGLDGQSMARLLTMLTASLKNGDSKTVQALLNNSGSQVSQSQWGIIQKLLDSYGYGG
jgi:hypothetical protein